MRLPAGKQFYVSASVGDKLHTSKARKEEKSGLLVYNDVLHFTVVSRYNLDTEKRVSESE